MRELAEFLELDSERVDMYLDDLEMHRSESVDAYRKGGHTSSTASGDVSYHAKGKLTPTQEREFDEYYRSHFPELFERYLAHYAVD